MPLLALLFAVLVVCLGLVRAPAARLAIVETFQLSAEVPGPLPARARSTAHQLTPPRRTRRARGARDL